jgi:hypothetical protein
MKPKLSFGPHFFLQSCFFSCFSYFTFSYFCFIFIYFRFVLPCSVLTTISFCLTLDFILILLCFVLACTWFLFHFFSLLFPTSLLFIFCSSFVWLLLHYCYAWFLVLSFFLCSSFVGSYFTQLLLHSLIRFSSRFPQELDLNYWFYFTLVTFGS